MELIGHVKTKQQLQEAVKAAMKRNTSVPHILLAGAAGCGKTSMARYVAELLEAPFLSIVPNDLSGYRPIMKTIEQLNHDNYDDMGNRVGPVTPTVVFLDEVHNLPLKGQELMGLIMERFIIESGKPNMFHWVPYFTLIGATTIAGKLSKPFRDRFKLNFTFQHYPIEEMDEIVRLHASLLGVKILRPAIRAISKRSRGTPRIAVGFLERVRDRMVATETSLCTSLLVEDVFNTMGIDGRGFTSVEMKILKALFDAGGQPVGIDNLSIITQEDRKTLRDSIEPFLIREGLMFVSGKGRVLSEEGIAYVENSGKADRPVKKEIEFNYKRN